MRRLLRLTESDVEIDVPFSPPLVYIGLLIVGIVIGNFVPIPVPSSVFAPAVGISLALVGVYLLVTSDRAFARADTPPDFRPVKAVVTEGPYRYTRNPMYISFSLIYAGVGVAFESLVALLLLFAAIVLIDRMIIPREEKYLEQRFGEEYLRYKSKVRRWT